MRSVRGTHPGKHTPGGRDRGPGCAQAPCEGRGANLLFCQHPGKTGPQRAESRYHKNEVMGYGQ
nr:MAG TPA_asm: hypothetical protein [Caudoviricetes sp.]